MPVATYGRGGKASTEITTKFLGAAGFDFDVSASEYAVEVDTPVRYTVTVFNRGTGAETNVGIVVELPPQMEFKEAKGPAGDEVPRGQGRRHFRPAADARRSTRTRGTRSPPWPARWATPACRSA